MVGLNDLKGLFQPQWFYDSTSLYFAVLIFRRQRKGA